jgi:hypothetical protein
MNVAHFIPMINAQQLGAIHVLAKKAGMDDDTYRDFLERETGHRSAKDLTMALGRHVIDKLKAIVEPDDTAKAKGAVAGLATPLGGKLRALWIAGYNLGIVQDRSDRAMLAYVERQTGVSHTRFFTDPRQGTQAVEGLKGWLARAGVAWPSEKDDEDAVASRRAVVDAQWFKLVQLRAVTPFGLEPFAMKVSGCAHWSALQGHHYDAVSSALGRKLRAVQGAPGRHERAEDVA